MKEFRNGCVAEYLFTQNTNSHSTHRALIHSIWRQKRLSSWPRPFVGNNHCVLQSQLSLERWFPPIISLSELHNGHSCSHSTPTVQVVMLENIQARCNTTHSKKMVREAQPTPEFSSRAPRQIACYQKHILSRSCPESYYSNMPILPEKKKSSWNICQCFLTTRHGAFLGSFYVSFYLWAK